MKELASFNAMVLKWANRQPSKYRLTALAFGYRCDRKTDSFSGTLKWISQQSRKRSGEGVSRAKLADDLKVFEASGVITVERRRNGSFNMSSVYHVDFGKVIEVEDMGKRQRRRNRADQAESDSMSRTVDDPEHAAWLASLGDEPPEDIEPPKHSGTDMDACPACLPADSRDEWDDGRLRKHLAGGGQDPWDGTWGS